MKSKYFNLSSITESISSIQEEVTFKGEQTVQFVLTGINESLNKALSIELRWGDYTSTEYYERDIFFNYREESIFNEVLYDKPGGTICTTYDHTFNVPVSSTSVSLTSQIIIYFSNGTYADFYQPLKFVKESYYDKIQEFSILNTQIQSTSSRTIANLESKDGQAYITVLEPAASLNSAGLTQSVEEELDLSTVNLFATHASEQIDSRIDSSMTMLENGLIYSNANHTQGSYTRNPDFWGADLDLTCISPWNSQYYGVGAGTLITPRHFVTANHLPLSVGYNIRFIEEDGTYHQRTITSRVNHPNITWNHPDVAVYTLNEDLPATISPCKIIPPDISNYLEPPLTEGGLRWHEIATLCLDQEEKGLITDFANFQDRIYMRSANFTVPVDDDRKIFYEEKVGNDSGNPAFFVVNGELVLITVWLNSGAGSGTDFSSVARDDYDWNDLIAAADAAAGVSTGYQVEYADFSEFYSFV